MKEVAVPEFGDRIVIELSPGGPIELGDLSGSFAALARVYERHYRIAGDNAPKLHVTRLETGSVIMEIAPFTVLLGALSLMDGGVIVADFTNRLWRAIKAFSAAPHETPRVEPPSNEDAKDIREFTKPLLGKNGASLGIKHARYERHDGQRSTVVSYDFDESELNRAAINIDKVLGRALVLATPPREILTLPSTDQKIRSEVMLFMEQTKRGPGKEKGRTGDKGVIPDISDKALPVYFRNSFQNLKDQMTKQANAMTSAFVVDVHVQYVNGEPKGYIVTDVHDVIQDDEPS